MAINNSLSNAPSKIYLENCRLFQWRQDAITLTHHLVKIIKSIQQHRGMSMGFLGGDLSFQEEIIILQKQLEKRISVLHALTSKKSILNELNKNNLINGWTTISQNWQGDTVIDNYELHCHLIDQFLHTLTSLSFELNKPILMSSVTDSEEDASYSKHLKIVNFTTHLLPSIIEKIGRVRALATYAAAAQGVDTHHKQKLQYAIQCVRDEKTKFLNQVLQLEPILEQDLLLSPLKSYEVKLIFLLKIIESDILKRSDANADSHQIYNLSSDIMDKYLSMVGEGMLLVTAWHEEDLESWLMA